MAMAGKSEEVILNNSMSEEDPNQNFTGSEPQEVDKPRWGPQHAGAKQLAAQYTNGLYSLSFSLVSCNAFL